jgi:anti-sigma regulatory factor (Ser/Thr protein kinase)
MSQAAGDPERFGGFGLGNGRGMDGSRHTTRDGADVATLPRGMTLERPDVELEMPAEPDSVALARQMVRGIIDRLGWSDESRTDISIAVTEACTNAVLHAYPDSTGDYEVFAWAEPEKLVVAVRDHGQGISPRVPSPSAGLGLGMPLMLAIADEVNFTSEGGVTEVRMSFTPGSRREDV